MPHEETDPRYRDSEYRGNPQHAPVKIVRAMQGPKPRRVGDTNTPMRPGEGRMHAAKPWRPKGRRKR